MKILYIMPRFHTNQLDLMKNWVESGNEVKLITYHSYQIEDYSCVIPVVLGYSKLSEFVISIYEKINKNNQYRNVFRMNFGFPPIDKLKKEIKSFSPDIIIVRDRTIYSIISYLLRGKAKCILYNQNPYLGEAPKTDLIHKILYKVTPKVRITPVMGRGEILDSCAYYVPFVVDTKISPGERTYFKNNVINILMVGKFLPVKNHILFLNVIKRLSMIDSNFKVRVVGSAVSDIEIEHLSEIKDKANELGISDIVEFIVNVKPTDMWKYYIDADVFVNPCENDKASVSQLEAMSYSVPVICSDRNGTAHCINNGENGYTFTKSDEEDLLRVMILMMKKNEIIRMGDNAYKSIEKEYGFEYYINTIIKISSTLN